MVQETDEDKAVGAETISRVFSPEDLETIQELILGWGLGTRIATDERVRALGEKVNLAIKDVKNEADR